MVTILHDSRIILTQASSNVWFTSKYLADFSVLPEGDVTEFSMPCLCGKLLVYFFFKRKHQKYCVVFKVFYSYNKVIINVQIMAIT